MWFLQNLLSAGFCRSLPVGKDLVVGRKDCDILIEKDSSVSRKHAVITVSENSKDSAVQIADLNSKFGTFINGVKVSPQSKHLLRHNDEIRFGQSPITGRFKLVFRPLVFCCSSMSPAEKSKLKRSVAKLGGKLENSWSPSCTHLVMSALTVTVKVVSALASCRPIVTPSWVEAGVKCLEESQSLPRTDLYLPKVVDVNLCSTDEVSFAPDYRRRNLFQDHIFYFLDNKQYGDLHGCIESAGAKCKLIDSPDSESLEILVTKESVVLSPRDPASDEGKWISKIQQFLRRQELRCISDSEIGFALLHMSTETYCNPKHCQVPEATDPLPPPSLSQMPFDSQSQSSSFPHPSNTTSPLISNAQNSQTKTTKITLHARPSLRKKVIIRSSQKNSKVAESTSIDASSDGKIPTKIDESSASLTESHLLPKGRPTQSSNLPPLAMQEAGRNVAAADGAPVKRKRSPLDEDFSLSPVDVRSKLDPPSRKKKIYIAPTSNEQSIGDSIKTEESKDKSKNVSSTSSANSYDRSVAVTKPANQMESQQNTLQSSNISILAPSSLTPSSGSKAGGAGNLPSSGLMTEIFKGRKSKKRRAIFYEDDDDEEEEDEDNSCNDRDGSVADGTGNKRQCMETDTGSVSNRSQDDSQTGKLLFGGMRSKGSRKKVESDTSAPQSSPFPNPVSEVKSNGDTVKSKESDEMKVVTGKRSSSRKTRDDSRRNVGAEKEDKSTIIILDPDELPSSERKPKTTHYLARPLDPVSDGNDNANSIPLRDHNAPKPKLEKNPDPVSNSAKETSSILGRAGGMEPRTPKKRRKEANNSLMSSSTPFLSTRKRRKKSVTPGPVDTPHNSSMLPADSSTTAVIDTTFNFSTQKSFTSLSFAKLKEAVPLTAVSTGGRRTKVTPAAAAETLWMQEDRSEVVGGGMDLDEEDPLGETDGGGGGMPSSSVRCYQPVLTVDGFIKARATPQLKPLSRFGRLAQRANNLLTSQTTPSESSKLGPSQPVVTVGVELTNLVVVSDGRKRTRGVAEEQRQELSSRLRNFKKFRKVQHAGNGVPHYVNVAIYVPEVNQELQDWCIMEGDGSYEQTSQENEISNEGSQDVFSLGTRRKRIPNRH